LVDDIETTLAEIPTGGKRIESDHVGNQWKGNFSGARLETGILDSLHPLVEP
jgi:hypothetical protein